MNRNMRPSSVTTAKLGLFAVAGLACLPADAKNKRGVKNLSSARNRCYSFKSQYFTGSLQVFLLRFGALSEGY